MPVIDADDVKNVLFQVYGNFGELNTGLLTGCMCGCCNGWFLRDANDKLIDEDEDFLLLMSRWKDKESKDFNIFFWGCRE